MPDAHKNFAVSAVATAPVPAASGTSLTVTAGQGARFPSTPFNASVWPDGFQPDPTNAEVVRVTAIVGDVLTIVRAQEGSSARAILVTDQIAATITAKTLTDAEAGVQELAVSNTTYNSGTVSITGVGGGVTVASNTGQRIDISVAAPIAQSVQPETQTFVGGISASDALYTSGTVRLTGVGGGVTVSSNTGQRVDISVAAPVAQTVQTQNAVDLTLAGNTAGALALVSSGTATLAGGANITLSQAGNAITISGAAAGAATAISGLANSQTTYTSGTVSLSELGAVTIRSTTGNQFQISVNAQSVQAETQTFIGGISASNTLYTSGSVRFTGSNAVTVKSGTGQLVVIDVPTQTTQVETQTFVGGIVGSNATYTSGTVTFTGVGGGVTVSSNTGQRVDISVAAPVAQTNQSGNVYASSNTFGTSSGTYDARSISIAGRGAVSVAASNSGWVISAPTQTTQVETQTFVGGIANSQTTYTSGTVSLSELGAVTVRSTTGNQYQISVNSQTVQTQNVVDVTLSGNTAGVMALVSSGTLTLAGGNNITVSQAGNAVTISGANVGGAQTGISGIANSQTTFTSGTVSLSELGAITIRSTTGNQYQLSVNSQTNQSGNVYASSNTFGTSSGTYDARSISIAGSGNVSVAASNSGWVISVPASVAQTNQSGNVYASSNTFGTSSGTYDARSISIAGRGAVSVAASNSGWIVSAPVQTAQTGISGISNSNTTYTSGTIGLSELGAITIRSTTGNQFQFSVNSQTAQTGISGVSNSNTTYTSGTIGLSELGAITIRSTTGNQFQFSVNSQTVQTQNFVAVSATNTLYTSGTVLFTGSNMITVKSSGAGQTVILDATQSVQTQGILNVALSNIGNTQGDTGINSGTRLVLAGGNNITLSGSSAANASTITIIGPTPGAAQYSVGVSTGGNTSGNTGVSGTRIVFAATNNITLSQATDATGATITISGPTAGAFSAGASTGGNTAGATGITGTQLVFVGSSPVSLSQTTGTAGGTITINAPATSSLSGVSGIKLSTNASTISIGYGMSLADWENMAAGNAQLATHVSAISKTAFFWNDEIAGDLTAKSLALRISMVTASQPLSVSVHLGVYTFVNSTSASRLASHSEAFVVSSASSVSLSGIRALIMTGIGTHATLSTISGGEYMLGLMFSATATNAMNFSLYGAGSANGALGGLYPGTNNLSTATSQGIQALAGRLSTTVNAMPANVVASDLVNYGQAASMQLHPWVYIRS